MRYLNISADRDSVVLRHAYDAAIEEAHDLGVVTTDILESAMAIRIMAAIVEGEYDLEQLKRWALSEIDGSRFPAPTKPPPANKTDAKALY